MYGRIKEHLQQEIQSIKSNGLFKEERIITSSQDAVIKVSTGEEVLNFCSNNYFKRNRNQLAVLNGRWGRGMFSILSLWSLKLTNLNVRPVAD